MTQRSDQGNKGQVQLKQCLSLSDELCSRNHLNRLKIRSNEYTDLMNASGSTAATFHKNEVLFSILAFATLSFRQ